MNRWIGALAVAAAAVAPAVAPAPARAGHVCAGVETDTTVGPPLSAGTQCTTMPMHLCEQHDVGVVPTVVLTAEFCVPR